MRFNQGALEAHHFNLPIVDHHAHLRHDPSSMEAVKRFERLGGSHIFLATQNYGPDVPLSIEDYRSQYETTLAIVRSIAKETTVQAFPVLAPYPVDLVRVAPRLGLARAVELQGAALDLAGKYVQEGLAVALGEVGRAHFDVPGEVRDALRSVLEHALAVGRDVNCPLVLHTEDLDAGGYAGLAELARRSGFPASRLVKHYACSLLPPELRQGVAPSFLARKDLVVEVLPDPGPWFLETDYLADPARPGAVLALETIPRRVAALLRENAQGEGLLERLTVPFVEGPRKVYGLDLQRKD